MRSERIRVGALVGLLVVFAWIYLKVDEVPMPRSPPRERPEIGVSSNAEAREKIYDFKAAHGKWWSEVGQERWEELWAAGVAGVVSNMFRVELSEESVGRIKRSSERASPPPHMKEKAISSVDEAVRQYKDHFAIPLGGSPSVYFETDEFYGFSGGVGTSKVYDFSSGILVSKSNGWTYIWITLEPKVPPD